MRAHTISSWMAALALACAASNASAVSLVRGPYVQMGHFTNQSTIVWRTDVSADSWVDYGLTTSYGATASGGAGYQHEVTLTGLQPGTTYYYRVRSGGANLASAQFRSAKASGMPFRIGLFSDAHQGGSAEIGSLLALCEPDLLLGIGDLTDEGTYSDLDNNVFSKMYSVLSAAPLYWTPGNHDVADNFAACREAFVLPGDEMNYWFEYADAQIVSLNAEGLPGAAWLENALAGSSKPWKIVFFHEAAYSPAGGHGENATIRDQYVPVMERHGVQLAVVGHNHYFWRSSPINGVTHLMPGRCGNRSRDTGEVPCYSQAAVNGDLAKTFALLEIDGSFMHIRGFNEYGTLLDESVIERGCPFTLDGAVDGSAVRVGSRAGGQSIWAALSGHYLYLATEDAGEGNDVFLMLSSSLGSATNVAWGKTGLVMAYDAFLADENDNMYSGWFAGDGNGYGNLYAARATTPWCGGGVLEGVIDLQDLYGGVPDTFYIAAAPFASADGGALAAATQCPAGNGDGNVDPGEYAVVHVTDLVQPFVMDGAIDHGPYLVADQNGMKLWAALYGDTLYVATWAAGNSDGANDHFIFVTDTLSGPGPAPWAKAGQVAVDCATKPYLADESASDWVAWHNAGASATQRAAAVNSGQMEGTINLVEAFGAVPDTLYFAVLPYATADAGALYAPSQVPLGNGDGNVDSNEFLAVPIVALRDENLDGRLDRLDPNHGFVFGAAPAPRANTNGWAVTWPSVPGHVYRVERADNLLEPFQGLSSDLVAAPGEFNMRYEDTTTATNAARYYRVLLLEPENP